MGASDSAEKDSLSSHNKAFQSSHKYQESGRENIGSSKGQIPT